MSDREREVMETLSKILPQLPESKQNYLLGYGEAIADMKKNSQEERGKPDE